VSVHHRGERARIAAHGDAGAGLGDGARRHAALLQANLLLEDRVQRRLALGGEPIEPDPHPGRHARARGVVLADPDDGAVALEQRRGVDQLEIQLEARADRQRLARPDEDSAAAHVDAVAFDELLQALAAKFDPEVDGSACVFVGGLGHVEWDG
jgi:hypothetical protein